MINECLRVTAVLNNGFSSQFNWTPSIDGIIAYQWMKEKLGVNEFIETHGVTSMQSTVDDLPIEKVVFNDIWWYKCSSPIFSLLELNKTHIHRRFNVVEVETRAAGKLKKIEVTKGAYKNARIPVNNKITGSVEWHVCGDKKEITRLLNTVTHIGSQRRAGFGAVQKWIVEVGGDIEKANLYRPLPIEFAKQHGVNGVEMDWAIRPPAKVVDNMKHCIIPVHHYDR